MDWQKIIDFLFDWLTTTGMKIIISLVLLLVSFRVITILSRKAEKKFIGEKKNLDKTLATTLIYLVRITLKALVVVCLVGYLGIDTSGFTALIASLGVGVGLAVNGALANLAGGALILITRPFRVDDFIEAEGFSGIVEDIHIINTRLRTPDNKVVYIPNGTLSAGVIVNYSEKNFRRVDFEFTVGYEADFEAVKSLIEKIVCAHEKVHSDPAPFVRMSEHGTNGIKIVTRVWTNSADYWNVKFDILERVKAELDRQGIQIPYNQLDVHIKREE